MRFRGGGVKQSKREKGRFALSLASTEGGGCKKEEGGNNSPPSSLLMRVYLRPHSPLTGGKHGPVLLTTWFIHTTTFPISLSLQIQSSHRSSRTHSSLINCQNALMRNKETRSEYIGRRWKSDIPADTKDWNKTKTKGGQGGRQRGERQGKKTKTDFSRTTRRW